MNTEEYLRLMHPRHMQGWHQAAVGAVVAAWDRVATLPPEADWFANFHSRAFDLGWEAESLEFWRALVADEKDRRHGPVERDDRLEVLVDRPYSARLAAGDTVTSASGTTTGSLHVRTDTGTTWAVGRHHVRKADVIDPPVTDAIINTWLRDGEHPPASVDPLVTLFGINDKAVLGKLVRHKWYLWMNRDEPSSEQNEPEPEPSEPEPEAEALRRALRDAEQAHERDIRLIGEALLNEAERRDWCEEYDEVIARLNRELRVDLPIRTREVDVTVTGYARVPFSTTVTVTVAPGESAQDEASEAFDPGSVTQYSLDFSSMEVDNDSLDFEEE